MLFRSRYEEESVRLGEEQAKALEELEDKHRAVQEDAQSAAERERSLLVAVSRPTAGPV